jgi:hypothetical protein
MGVMLIGKPLIHQRESQARSGVLIGVVSLVPGGVVNGIPDGEGVDTGIGQC